MKVNDCCLDALKHGFHTCPHCGKKIVETTSKNIEIESDGQVALLLGKPKQLVINFNQRTK